MADQDDFDVRREIVALLLEKVEADRFPSSSMMNAVEQLLGPDEVPAYASILMDKIRADRFPSLDLVARAMALT